MDDDANQRRRYPKPRGQSVISCRSAAMKSRTFAIALFSLTCFGADQDFPSVQISSSSVTAKILLPDAERGYYRGTRFDWSGVIKSLKAKDHEYFGQWFPKYDPKLHDAIM